MTFKSIFAVPTDIVDKHIRLANEHQLKVLLWILRNSPEDPDIQKMCKALKMNPDDASDYLQYWVLTGVLTSDGTIQSRTEQPEAKSEPKIEAVPELEKKTAEAPAMTPSKPSSAEIAERIEESPDIGHLFNEAQKKLGKTIGYDGQCTLLLLHDHYGLPVEVIFMLIDYCVSVGKTNYGYIETIGRDWGGKEIDTLEKAAAKIHSLNNSNRLWKELSEYAGLGNPRPTPKQCEYIRRWSEEWGFGIDVICHAYDEMATNTGKVSFSYMDKVLMNWHSSGYRTVSDIESGEVRRQESKKSASKSTDKANAPSYDLDEFKNSDIHGTLKYERKKKK